MNTGLVALLDRAIAWRSGRRYPLYLRQYRAMQTWSREQMRAWQFEKLQRLLAHAYATVPYWTEVMDGLGARPQDFRSIDDLRRLPYQDKALIIERRDDLTSRKGGRGETRDRSTGGSTGRNIYFKVDRETQDRRRAAGRLTELWDDIVPGTRMATLWGSSLETAPSRASQLYDKLANRLFLSAYGVGDEELREYWKQLLAFRPEVLSSYPSILLHVARRAGRERCRALGVRLIYLSSEALYPSVRAEIETAFGAIVRNRYASREFGMIASDAPDGRGLYLMDMRLIVEPLDPHHAGAPTELVITDLDNHVMPFIRYRIEDLGVFAPPEAAEPWPFTRVASIEGRSLDVIVTPEGKAFGGTFFTLILRPFDRSIDQFQVVQDHVDHVTIKLVAGPGFGDDGAARVKDAVVRAMGPALRVDVEVVPEIPLLLSGKRRFVVSLLGANAPQVAGK